MKTKITGVKFTPYKKKKLKGFISITFNDEITVNGFKLIKGKKGDYIGFPAHYSEEEDKWYNDVYIADEDDFTEFQDEAMKKLKKKSASKKKTSSKKKDDDEDEDDEDEDEEEDDD